MEQACTAGLQAIAVAAAEVQCNGFDTVGALTFDRTSDSSNAKDRGFLNRYALTFEVLNTQGKAVGVIDSDTGVRRVNRETLRAMKERRVAASAGRWR